MKKNVTFMLFVEVNDEECPRTITPDSSGCTTFRRKSFRRYDFWSHTTFGRCDVFRRILDDMS